MSWESRLDQWLTTPPEPQEQPLPGDPEYPRCSGCGCFLRLEPDRRVADCAESSCDGELYGELGCAECGKLVRHDPHPVVLAGWDVLYRKCKRCGLENEEVIL